MDNERRAGSTVTIPDGTQSGPDANTITTSRSKTPPPPPLSRKATDPEVELNSRGERYKAPKVADVDNDVFDPNMSEPWGPAVAIGIPTP